MTLLIVVERTTVSSSIVCPVCHSMFHVEARYCPVCSSPNNRLNATEMLKITNTQGFIVNVGESTFDYKHMLRLQFVASGKKVDINFEKYLMLGRESLDHEPHINLENHGGQDAGVSRRHARLIRHPFSLICQDLNSTNGTYINGEFLEPNRPALLRDGDELRLGSLKIRVSFIPAQKDV